MFFIFLTACFFVEHCFMDSVVQSPGSGYSLTSIPWNPLSPGGPWGPKISHVLLTQTCISVKMISRTFSQAFTDIITSGQWLFWNNVHSVSSFYLMSDNNDYIWSQFWSVLYVPIWYKVIVFLLQGRCFHQYVPYREHVRINCNALKVILVSKYHRLPNTCLLHIWFLNIPSVDNIKQEFCIVM